MGKQREVFKDSFLVAVVSSRRRCLLLRPKNWSKVDASSAGGDSFLFRVSLGKY